MITALEFFVNAQITAFKYRETCLFGVADRERFGDDWRVDARNHLSDGMFAQWAHLQGWALDWPSQLKSARADAT